MIIGEEIRLFDWFIIHFTEKQRNGFWNGVWRYGESIYSVSFEY